MNYEERIEKLERTIENIAGMVAGIGLLAVVWMGVSLVSDLRSSPDVLQLKMDGRYENASIQIHAEKNHILVTDHYGKPLARMSTEAKSRGRIALYGNDDEPLYVSSRKE